MVLGVSHLERPSIDNAQYSVALYVRSRTAQGSSMKHLKYIQESYLQHLCFAWRVAGVLIVHGLLPEVWGNKASDMMHLKEVERQEKLRRGRSGYE